MIFAKITFWCPKKYSNTFELVNVLVGKEIRKSPMEGNLANLSKFEVHRPFDPRIYPTDKPAHVQNGIYIVIECSLVYYGQEQTTNQLFLQDIPPPSTKNDSP